VTRSTLRTAARIHLGALHHQVDNPVTGALKNSRPRIEHRKIGHPNLGDRGLSVGDGQCKDGRLGGNEHPNVVYRNGDGCSSEIPKKSNAATCTHYSLSSANFLPCSIRTYSRRKEFRRSRAWSRRIEQAKSAEGSAGVSEPWYLQRSMSIVLWATGSRCAGYKRRSKNGVGRARETTLKGLLHVPFVRSLVERSAERGSLSIGRMQETFTSDERVPE
jgi:hypothetical protein